MHGRSTTRYLYRLTSKINTSRNNKKVGLLLLIDFEKAYDSVWVEGLLKKMLAAGLTGKMWVLTADYLLTRRLNMVKFRDALYTKLVTNYTNSNCQNIEL